MPNFQIDIDQLRQMYPDLSPSDLEDLSARLRGDPSSDLPSYSPEIPQAGPYPDMTPSDGITGDSIIPDDANIKIQTAPAIPQKTASSAPRMAKAPQQPMALAEETPSPETPPNYRKMARDKIKEEYGLDKYSPENRENLVRNTKNANSPPNWAAGFSALGTGLQGGNAAQAGLNMLEYQRRGGKNSLEQFDQGRKSALENAAFGEHIGDKAEAQAKLKRESDLNSPESKIVQALGVKMGMHPNLAKKMSATQFKNFSPALSKMYEVAANNVSREKIAGASNVSHENVAKLNNTTRENISNNKGTNKRPISGANVSQIGEYDAALKLIDQLESSYNKNASAAGSSVGRWVNGAGANQYMDELKLTAQNVGRVLEGGKLTDKDYDRYIDRFGLPSDRNDKAKNKFNKIRQQIQIKRDAAIQAQKNAGYDSSNFSKSQDPNPGDTVDGYIFKGGDPGDQDNWEPEP